jgi:hypothetical protein
VRSVGRSALSVLVGALFKKVGSLFESAFMFLSQQRRVRKGIDWSWNFGSKLNIWVAMLLRRTIKHFTI